MDFTITKAQKELKREVIHFACEELKNLNDSEFDKSYWIKCAEFGLLGMSIPETYNGLGLDYLTTAIMLEALGYSCNDSGFIFTITNHLWACQQTIAEFGSIASKKMYLPDLISGKYVGCFAITEADSGSDVFNMNTKAQEMDEYFLLNGNKMFISNAPVADIFVVIAKTIDSNSVEGFTAFIVEKEMQGVHIGKVIEKMGLKACPMGEISFENCKIPKDNVLLSVNKGEHVANWALRMERVFEFASHIGAMERQMEMCVNYANERRQFGEPIKNNQSVTNPIADMKVSIELARTYLYKIAWMLDNKKNVFLESSILKLFVSENYVKTCMDALHIHGAYGYTKEYGYESELRNSIASTIYSGTSEMQRNIIFKLLDT